MTSNKPDYISIPLLQSEHVEMTLHTNFLQFVGEVRVRVTKALGISL